MEGCSRSLGRQGAQAACVGRLADAAGRMGKRACKGFTLLPHTRLVLVSQATHADLKSMLNKQGEGAPQQSMEPVPS
eukprot:1161551-Pelagomonas_calceolata.AAC.10